MPRKESEYYPPEIRERVAKPLPTVPAESNDGWKGEFQVSAAGEARNKADTAAAWAAPWITGGAIYTPRLVVWRLDKFLRWLEGHGGRACMSMRDAGVDADMSWMSWRFASLRLEEMKFVKIIRGKDLATVGEGRPPDTLVLLRPSSEFRETYKDAIGEMYKKRQWARARGRRKLAKSIYGQAVVDQEFRYLNNLDPSGLAKYGDRDVDDDEVDAWSW